MIVTCATCGKEFKTYPSYLARRRDGPYCSTACRGISLRRRATATCEVCGAVFEHRLSQHPRFCSVGCRAIWTARLRRARHRMSTCQTCGQVFPLKGNGYQPGNGKFCSRACYGISRRKASQDGAA